MGVLGLVCLACVGCGGEGADLGTATTPQRLKPAERRQITMLDGRIAAHCVAVSRSLVDPGAAPDPAEERRAFAAADRLVALARRKPRAPLGAGQDMRLFVSDVVENLEGSNCDPRMVARLERGLAEIPRG
jgi:hypothetical protein